MVPLHAETVDGEEETHGDTATDFSSGGVEEGTAAAAAGRLKLWQSGRSIWASLVRSGSARREPHMGR